MKIIGNYTGQSWPTRPAISYARDALLRVNPAFHGRVAEFWKQQARRRNCDIKAAVAHVTLEAEHLGWDPVALGA